MGGMNKHLEKPLNLDREMTSIITQRRKSASFILGCRL